MSLPLAQQRENAKYWRLMRADSTQRVFDYYATVEEQQRARMRHAKQALEEKIEAEGRSWQKHVYRLSKP